MGARAGRVQAHSPHPCRMAPTACARLPNDRPESNGHHCHQPSGARQALDIWPRHDGVGRVATGGYLSTRSSRQLQEPRRRSFAAAARSRRSCAPTIIPATAALCGSTHRRRALVGLTGAGLTNLLATPQGSCVVELVGPKSFGRGVDNTYAALAGQLGLVHTRVHLRPSWSVDRDALTLALARC